MSSCGGLSSVDAVSPSAAVSPFRSVSSGGSPVNTLWRPAPRLTPLCPSQESCTPPSRRGADTEMTFAIGAERFRLPEHAVRRCPLLDGLAHSRIGVDTAEDGAIRLSVNARCFGGVVRYLTQGRVAVDCAQEYYGIRECARYLGMAGIPEHSVEPLGARLDIRARRVCEEMADKFLDEVWIPWAEEHVRAGVFALHFFIVNCMPADGADWYTQCPDYYLHEDAAAFRLLETARTRDLWIDRMEQRTGKRVELVRYLRHMGPMVLLRVAVRPAPPYGGDITETAEQWEALSNESERDADTRPRCPQHFSTGRRGHIRISVTKTPIMIVYDPGLATWLTEATRDCCGAGEGEEGGVLSVSLWVRARDSAGDWNQRLCTLREPETVTKQLDFVVRGTFYLYTKGSDCTVEVYGLRGKMSQPEPTEGAESADGAASEPPGKDTTRGGKFASATARLKCVSGHAARSRDLPSAAGPSKTKARPGKGAEQKELPSSRSRSAPNRSYLQQQRGESRDEGACGQRQCVQQCSSSKTKRWK